MAADGQRGPGPRRAAAPIPPLPPPPAPLLYSLLPSHVRHSIYNGSSSSPRRRSIVGSTLRYPPIAAPPPRPHSLRSPSHHHYLLHCAPSYALCPTFCTTLSPFSVPQAAEATHLLPASPPAIPLLQAISSRPSSSAGAILATCGGSARARQSGTTAQQASTAGTGASALRVQQERHRSSTCL